jgi:transcriptional regulator with XRE-family HTH domain
MPKVGDVIYVVRKLKGWKKRDLAKALGCDLTKVFDLEHDKPKVLLDTIVRACRELEIVFDHSTREAQIPKQISPSLYESILAARQKRPRQRRGGSGDGGVPPAGEVGEKAA